MLFHKTTLRERYDDAALRHADADDVILLNTRGEVTESTRANVAVRIEGRWYTPPLDSGLLPGCERAALVRDGTLAERVIVLDELFDAQGVALLSSVRPWRDAVVADPALRP